MFVFKTFRSSALVLFILSMANFEVRGQSAAVTPMTVVVINSVFVTNSQISTMTVPAQTLAGSNLVASCPNNSQCNSTSFQCLAGYRVTDDLNGCTRCSPGYIKSDIGNQQQCSQCPIGQEPNQQQIACVDCQSGKYKPSQLYLQCVDCPLGGNCTTTTFSPSETTTGQQQNNGNLNSLESIIQLPMSTLILVASAFGVGLLISTVTTWICCGVRAASIRRKHSLISPSTINYDTYSGISTISASIGASAPNDPTNDPAMQDARTMQNGISVTNGYTRKTARLANDPEQTLHN